ncbi:unnamed protein product [Mucor hiemalis]
MSTESNSPSPAQLAVDVAPMDINVTDTVTVALGDKQDSDIEYYEAKIKELMWLSLGKRIPCVKESLERLQEEKKRQKTKDSEKKGTQESKHATKNNKVTGLRLTRRDIPKFQLRYHYSPFFKGCPVYATVEIFINQFEKVIKSAGVDVYDVWRELIPLSFPPELDNLVKNELCAKLTWTDAIKLLVTQFGSYDSVLQAKRKVFTMTMDVGDTANNWCTKFNTAMSEAGYNKDDTTLADFFFDGYPMAWQSQINTVLAANDIPMDSPRRTVAKIAELAASIYNGTKAPGNGQGAKRVGHEDKQGHFKKFKHGHGDSSTRVTKDFHTKEGKLSEVVNSKDIKDTKKFKPLFLGTKNVPHVAGKSRNDCHYCHKPRQGNHWCKEYLQAKNEGRLNHKGASNKVVLSVLQEDDEDIIFDNDPLFDCKGDQATW